MRKPLHTVIQFSDVHVVPEGELLHGTVDTLANLAAALDEVEAAALRPAALLFTGDLADAGDAASYRRLRETAEKAAARIGAPALFGMGNHDKREAFHADLLGGLAVGHERDFVHQADGLRVVMLDTTEPGSHHGDLTDAQLAWLREQLATPAEHGTILALHHPPIPSPLEILEMLTLRQYAELAEVVRGTDVRLVVAGHAHHATCGSLGGVPVWVAPATAYTADVLAPAGLIRGTAGGGYTRIDVYADEATATFVPVGRGAPVYELDVETLRRYMAEHGAAAQA
ncbi:metallophosphoesterase [Streptodolium elevatio]|uniref:Metallophosphoesterase n=1 Tax=Streptodolium elevatio TaxID=3157996 RepID=A0ABV3DGD0_9ACTN